MAVLTDDSGNDVLDSDGLQIWTTFAGVPDNLILVSKDDDQVDMSWDAAAGATGYDISRDGVVIATDEAGLTYTDTPLDPATEYDHRVRAVLP
jgi:hypothetical protein